MLRPGIEIVDHEAIVRANGVVQCELGISDVQQINAAKQRRNAGIDLPSAIKVVVARFADITEIATELESMAAFDPREVVGKAHGAGGPSLPVREQHSGAAAGQRIVWIDNEIRAVSETIHWKRTIQNVKTVAAELSENVVIAKSEAIDQIWAKRRNQVGC